MTNLGEMALKDSFVAGKNSEGVAFRGKLLKLTRLSGVFELYNPLAIIRFSESLSDFKITLNDREMYSGKAAVRNLLNTGSAVVICEVTLDEAAWTDMNLASLNGHMGLKLRSDYQDFLREWQKLYVIRPEYKLILADMQTYFSDLRLWLDQLGLGIRAMPANGRTDFEKEIAADLAPPIVATMTSLFEQFEDRVLQIEPGQEAAHQLFARRQLHPLLLCSPFLNRCYVKPLGYAGDYEMVNMMLRSPYEGDSLFAKVTNVWFIQQAPAEAHRNRIDYLVRQLISVCARAVREGRRARILNVACGPAQEVQRFLANHEISSYADISLLDFNEETLTNTRALMNEFKSKHQRNTTFNYIKKSVYNIVKESGKILNDPSQPKYDFVYCAGLFDYLSNQVCQHMMNVMYEWTAPGGLLVSTNVDSSNPRRLTMDYVMDWHLIYRSGAELADVKPDTALADNCRVISDITGVNVYLEVTKPES